MAVKPLVKEVEEIFRKMISDTDPDKLAPYKDIIDDRFVMRQTWYQSVEGKDGILLTQTKTPKPKRGETSYKDDEDASLIEMLEDQALSFAKESKKDIRKRFDINPDNDPIVGANKKDILRYVNRLKILFDINKIQDNTIIENEILKDVNTIRECLNKPLEAFCYANQLNSRKITYNPLSVASGDWSIVYDPDDVNNLIPALLESLTHQKAGLTLTSYNLFKDNPYRSKFFRGHIKLRYNHEIRSKYGIIKESPSPETKDINNLRKYWSTLREMACGVEPEHEEELILHSPIDDVYEPFSEERIERSKKLDILESVQGIAEMLELDRIPDPSDPDFDVVKRDGLYTVVLQKNPDILELIELVIEANTSVDKGTLGLGGIPASGPDLDNLKDYWLEAFSYLDQYPPSKEDIDALTVEHEEELILAADDNEAKLKRDIIDAVYVIRDSVRRRKGTKQYSGYEGCWTGEITVTNYASPLNPTWWPEIKDCASTGFLTYLQKQAFFGTDEIIPASDMDHKLFDQWKKEVVSRPAGEVDLLDVRKYWLALLDIVFYGHDEHEEELILHSDNLKEFRKVQGGKTLSNTYSATLKRLKGGETLPDEQETVSVFPEDGAKSFLFSADDRHRYKKIAILGALAVAVVIAIGVLKRRKEKRRQ